MQLYFTGESFRGVKNFLKLGGVKFSHQAVYNWVEKYTLLMEGYLEQIKPQLDYTWRTDELYIKVKGNMKYLFAMMDDETRFRIAQQIATNKGTDDVRPMFREAMEVAGKKPKVLISDGAPNFHRELSGEMQKGAVFVDPEGILNGHVLFYEGEVKDGTGVIAGKSLFADYIDSSTGEVRSISPTVMWDLAEGNKTEREDVDVEGLKNRVLVNIVNDET